MKPKFKVGDKVIQKAGLVSDEGPIATVTRVTDEYLYHTHLNGKSGHDVLKNFEIYNNNKLDIKDIIEQEVVKLRGKL